MTEHTDRAAFLGRALVRLARDVDLAIVELPADAEAAMIRTRAALYKELQCGWTESQYAYAHGWRERP